MRVIIIFDLILYNNHIHAEALKLSGMQSENLQFCFVSFMLNLIFQ